MLYDVGKGRAAMLHCVGQGIHPSLPPFPLLHVNSTIA